jgi:hypothetical protein
VLTFIKNSVIHLSKANINKNHAPSINDLRANEGRETNALNSKPNTNLKEKYELSNYSKTSGFILHAVMASAFYALTVCRYIS